MRVWVMELGVRGFLRRSGFEGGNIEILVFGFKLISRNKILYMKGWLR